MRTNSIASYNKGNDLLRPEISTMRPFRLTIRPIEIDPQYAYAWNNKGVALKSQGKYDEAIQAYNKAIE